MQESDKTDLQLLAKLRDSCDVAAWQEFATIYRPLVYRLGRRLGLQDADAQNLTQHVLLKVSGKLEQWSGTEFQSSPKSSNSSKSFRRWLATVAKNAAIDALRRVRPDAPRGGTSVQLKLRELSSEPGDSETLYRLELERQAFRWSAERIRNEFTDSTWMAFWQTMVEDRSCSDVAKELGKSVGSIYTSRSRVMQRLKDDVKLFDWQAAEAGIELNFAADPAKEIDNDELDAGEANRE